MAEEVLEYLNCRPGQVIMDCTLGEGGHARRILSRILPGGKLIGIDRDGEVLERARRNLRIFEKQVIIKQENFSGCSRAVESMKLNGVDGVLFDLGVSSFQLNSPARGFSFRSEGPLDMRMDRREEIGAADLVNRLRATELEEIIRDYSQERWARRISRAIVRTRRRQKLETTVELAGVIARAVPGRGRIHPATRTFQALRIYLNRELESLRQALPEAISLLKKGGRIIVISFHSLEDRIVKWEFRRQAKESGTIKIITPKPLRPSAQEVRSNRRSRSARFRVAEKI